MVNYLAHKIIALKTIHFISCIMIHTYQHILSRHHNCVFMSFNRSGSPGYVHCHALQKFVKHMEEAHKGAEMSKELALVQTAVLGMTEVAKHINEMKRHNENTQRVKEVQGRLVGWRGGVLAKYGDLVKEGMLAVEGAPRECLLFLLTRVLLFIKIGGLRYECVGHILCSRLILIESVPERPLTFVVTDICKTKVRHTLQAQTYKKKEQWIRTIKTLIAENHVLGSLDEMVKHYDGLDAGPGVKQNLH
uniref:PH domain-containing protein n=1 Tax=Eptatretus burgeri TaxID=7764 RepID=A0A8C4R767_EPTBU